MSKLLKRLDSLEKVQREILSRNYLAAVAIRSESDLSRYEGKIGPDTSIIKIVPATKRIDDL